MTFTSNILKATGLAVAVTAVSAGMALAAVATSTVNVRTGPSTGYAVVDTLSRGESVNIVDQSHGWCAVQKSGPDGWVSCSYLANAGYQTRIVRPGVSFSFGFGVGSAPHRPSMHSHDNQDDGYWTYPDHNDGPGWSNGPRDNGNFSLNF